MRTPVEIGRAMEEVRASTLQLFAAVDDAAFRLQAHPDFSPVGWHLGHVGVAESFWVLQQCQGEPPLSPFYDSFFTPTENPKPERVHLPPRGEILAYLQAVRDKTLRFLARTTFTTEHPLLRGGNVFHMLLQHEEQHTETVLLVLQLLGAARYDSDPLSVDEQLSALVSRFGGGGASRLFTEGPPRTTRNDMVHVPAGNFSMGSDDAAATLDNERPRHAVSVPAFAIDRLPVTNREFLRFVESGGYGEPSWWDPEGWQWRRHTAVRHPLYWREPSPGRWVEVDFGRARSLTPDRPVTGVSWYEADAYARSVGKRLPAEAEWEKAAAGGRLGGLARVWEWTSTWFHPYPGFRAHPYEGYSVPYFDQRHRVLRGGSWATRGHVTRPTFRNWYHPRVREVFAGFRCAKDPD